MSWSEPEFGGVWRSLVEPPGAACDFEASQIGVPSCAMTQSIVATQSEQVMAQGKPTVLVLWGNYFDEYATVTFVCELRSAGVRVRIVGVDGRLARGRYGMMLGAEWTIDRALQQHLPNAHLVVPCQFEQWLQLQQNPLIQRLFRQAREDGALIVTPHLMTAQVDDITDLAMAVPALPLPEAFLWSDEEMPGEAARRLARRLQA